MDIFAAYEQVGTYRGAAALCGTTHKTVRRMIEDQRSANDPIVLVEEVRATPTWCGT